MHHTQTSVSHGDRGLAQQREESSPVDVQVSRQGTIVLFYPATPEGGAWLAENVAEDAQWFGRALAVDQRYAAALIEGLVEGGLAVRP